MIKRWWAMEFLNQISISFVSFLLEASPFMLLGLFFAGALKAFLPDDLVKKHIGSNTKGGVFKASAFGVPIPLCSCGVVPAAAGIRKQGAGKGPVVSFLVSTPETGVDSIAITWAMLGPVMAVIRPVAAFITAVFTGTLVNFFDNGKDEDLAQLEEIEKSSCCSSGSCCETESKTPQINSINDFKMAEPEESCGCCHDDSNHGKSLFEKFKSGMNFAFIELTGDIAAWFLGGIVLAAAIAVFVTPEMVHSISAKNPFLIMFFMLLVSVPLYVCATSSTPIAAAFLLTGVSPGAAMVFLLAGPATNAASFSVISKIIGKRSAIIYLFGIVSSSVVIGLATDYFFSLTGYNIVPVVGEFKEGLAYYVEVSSAVIVSLLFGYHILGNIFRKVRPVAKTH